MVNGFFIKCSQLKFILNTMLSNFAKMTEFTNKYATKYVMGRGQSFAIALLVLLQSNVSTLYSHLTYILSK